MKKKIFLGVNTILITSILTKKCFTIKKIQNENFEPLIKKNSYVLIINKNIKKSPKTGFIYFFDQKTNKNKISYKISPENFWIQNKKLKTLIKIPKNFFGHCSYDGEGGVVVNEAFVLGYPVFDFGSFRFLGNVKVNFERFDYEISDFSLE